MESDVCDVIIAAGVPVNSRGYWYIREAVLMALEDREMLLYVTKDLYPKIATRYNTTPGSVERAIRSAVCRSWDTGNISCKLRFMCDGRPTNTQFVTYVYELVRASREQNEATGFEDP